jgi:capsular polysaccharide biosynthesis protein
MLLDGSLYAGGYRHELRHANQRRRIGFNPSGAAAEIERAAMVSTCAGTTWWGHWVEDEVPMQMLAEKFAAPVAFNRPEYRDECAYRQVFGIAEPKRLDVAHFHELLLLEDFAQNPNKTKRYRALRHRLARLPAGHERVYLRRGSTGVRRSLVNEAEVMQRLEGLGFKTVDVATNSAQDIIKSCRGAEVVVSIEGSHLAPLLYLMGDFATLVILNPPHQVHTTVADIGVFCGLTSGMFVCEPEGDTRTDFRADQDELARFIEDAVTFGKRNAPRMEGFLESVMRLDTSGTLLGENVSPQPIDISFEAA